MVQNIVIILLDIREVEFFLIMKCPLMSSSDNNYNVLCQEEECAWYVKAFKSCAMYIIAHNAALDIKAKQSKQR